MAHRDIVVIRASLGAVETLPRLTGGSRPICSLTRDRVEIKEREVNEKLEIETRMREVRQDPALAQCRGGSGGLRFPRIAGIVFA